MHISLWGWWAYPKRNSLPAHLTTSELVWGTQRKGRVRLLPGLFLMDKRATQGSPGADVVHM